MSNPRFSQTCGEVVTVRTASVGDHQIVTNLDLSRMLHLALIAGCVRIHTGNSTLEDTEAGLQ